MGEVNAYSLESTPTDPAKPSENLKQWLRSHVEAHVKVCFAAYAILALLEIKISGLGISAVDALDILRTGFRVKLCDQASGFEWETMVELESEQKKIRNVVYKNL